MPEEPTPPPPPPVWTADSIDVVRRNGSYAGNACQAAAAEPAEADRIWIAVWQANLTLNTLRDEQIAAATTHAQETAQAEIDALQARVEELQGQPPAGSVTQRQFRLALLHAGIEPSAIDAMIAQIKGPLTRESAKIEWEWASTIDRANPLVAGLAAVMGKTDEDIDQLFAAARSL